MRPRTPPLGPPRNRSRRDRSNHAAPPESTRSFRPARSPRQSFGRSRKAAHAVKRARPWSALRGVQGRRCTRGGSLGDKGQASLMLSAEISRTPNSSYRPRTCYRRSRLRSMLENATEIERCASAECRPTHQLAAEGTLASAPQSVKISIARGCVRRRGSGSSTNSMHSLDAVVRTLGRELGSIAWPCEPDR
jgi:hypothetical protein